MDSKGLDWRLWGRGRFRWGSRNWRRRRDSNPRYSFLYTRFPSVRLKPLGHLSVRYFPSIAEGLLLLASGTISAAGHPSFQLLTECCMREARTALARPLTREEILPVSSGIAAFADLFPKRAGRQNAHFEGITDPELAQAGIGQPHGGLQLEPPRGERRRGSSLNEEERAGPGFRHAAAKR